MLTRIKRLLLIGLIVCAYSCHTNTTVQIPLNNFFKSPAKTSFHISPDGKYISYLKIDNRKQNLFIRSLADTTGHMVASLGDYSVRDYFWTYDGQIIITQGDRDSVQLSAVNIATLKMHSLFKAQHLIFRMLNRKTADPDVVTCTLNMRDSSAIDVYRINTKTGELKMYVKNPGNIIDWFPDPDGKIRLAKASDGVNESILFRENDQAKFAPIIVNNFKNRVQPIAFTADKNYFYALSNVNRDKTALVEINATNINQEKVVYDTPNADIEDVGYLKSKHRLEHVGWQEAKPSKHFFDQHIKAIYTDLAAQLPGDEIKIVDRDSTENYMIISTYNDRNPGAYYLYTTATKKLEKLTDQNADIDSTTLCEMKAVSFKAGDGTVINGYLTLPKNIDPENLPVVVIPHTDLWRRNSWGYSADVQFLANRGYAVFQVNYRGSTGYGKAFYSAGFKQAGGKMQQDITDGVNWLIDQKIANPKKIAIYGSGFGGFSALYGAAFHPGMYNCVAVQNPLINLLTYVKDIPPFYKPMLNMRYEMVGNPEDPADAERFRAISPVFNTDKIKAPLLFVQREDMHTNMSEQNQFITELKRNGVAVTYDIIKQQHTDHGNGGGRARGTGGGGGGRSRGWRNEKDREHLYAELERFLAANLQDKK